MLPAGKSILIARKDPAWSIWLAHGWAQRPVDAEQLYDVIFDPNEAHGRVGAPGAASALADMRGRLQRWMEATEDPLLTGAVPAPTGGKVNDKRGASPRDEPRVVGSTTQA